MRLVSVFPGARALLGGALGGFWWFLGWVSGGWGRVVRCFFELFSSKKSFISVFLLKSC